MKNDKWVDVERFRVTRMPEHLEWTSRSLREQNVSQEPPATNSSVNTFSSADQDIDRMHFDLSQPITDLMQKFGIIRCLEDYIRIHKLYFGPKSIDEIGISDSSMSIFLKILPQIARDNSHYILPAQFVGHWAERISCTADIHISLSKALCQFLLDSGFLVIEMERMQISGKMHDLLEDLKRLFS